jgi:hypothetical protein
LVYGEVGTGVALCMGIRIRWNLMGIDPESGPETEH